MGGRPIFSSLGSEDMASLSAWATALVLGAVGFAAAGAAGALVRWGFGLGGGSAGATEGGGVIGSLEGIGRSGGGITAKNASCPVVVALSSHHS